MFDQGYLTKEDLKSLEAAQCPTGPKGMWQFKLSDGLRASYKLAGLGEAEMDLCAKWAGLHTPAGVSSECRYAKHVLDEVPIPPTPDLLNPGVVDKHVFWSTMGLAEHLDFFWQARHFLDQIPEPKTALGQVALKVIRYWRGFAEQNWPTAADLYAAVKRREAKHTGRKRSKNPEERVGLAELWRLTLHLERVWHGRGHRSTLNPEDIYEALGDLQAQVKVNCWSRDDATMVELLKRADGQGCSFCSVYSLDSFEFGWGGNTTSCPRCSGRMMERFYEKTPAPPEAKWDGGPTHPESGDYAYRWAIKHGLMWDEFLKEIRAIPIKFDSSKKTLCPLLDQCNTRCAQDQKDGVRAWPLGASDYETSCYKFGEILWCQENAGTPEQFAAMKRSQIERVEKKRKRTNVAKLATRAKEVAPAAPAPKKRQPEAEVQGPRMF